MKETKRLITFLAGISLFFLLGILIWIAFFGVMDEIKSIPYISGNNLYTNMQLLGISLILTFIFIFLFLFMQILSRSQTSIISPKIEQRIIKPTSVSQLSTSLGELLAEHKRIEEELRSREEWLSTALKSIGHAVITTDSKGIITFLNPVAERLTGWRTKDAENKTISDVFKTIQESTLQAVPDPLALVQQKNTNIYQSILITKDNKEITIDSSVAPMRNGKGDRLGMVIVFRDVTTEKKKEEIIKFQANYDDLTGLVNRRYLYQQFSNSLMLAKADKLKVAVIFMDLDRFKSVNDSMGHEVGDMLLKQVAERLKELVGKKDIVSRIAGDEFVVILGSIHSHEIGPFAQRLLEKMREPFIIRGVRLVITPSFGISYYPEDGDTLESLLNKADDAMYRAKNEGKNSFRFYGQKTS